MCNAWAGAHITPTVPGQQRPIASRLGALPWYSLRQGLPSMDTALRTAPLQPQAVQPVKLEAATQPDVAQVAAAWQPPPDGSSTPTSVLEGRPSSGSSSSTAAGSGAGSAGSAGSASSAGAIGEEAWRCNRQQWTGQGSGSSGPCKRLPQKHVLNPYASYEDIIGPDGTLEQPVPLEEMVEVLVDSWIDEGMYG